MVSIHTALFLESVFIFASVSEFLFQKALTKVAEYLDSFLGIIQIFIFRFDQIDRSSEKDFVICFITLLALFLFSRARITLSCFTASSINMPVCVFLLKLQSVFKDISYMVDPQNKVQVLVRSSPCQIITPVFHSFITQKSEHTIFLSLIRSSAFMCYCLFMQYKLHPHRRP